MVTRENTVPVCADINIINLMAGTDADATRLFAIRSVITKTDIFRSGVRTKRL